MSSDSDSGSNSDVEMENENGVGELDDDMGGLEDIDEKIEEAKKKVGYCNCM